MMCTETDITGEIFQGAEVFDSVRHCERTGDSKRIYFGAPLSLSSSRRWVLVVYSRQERRSYPQRPPRRFFLAAFAPSLPRAVRVLPGKWAIVRPRLAALTAFFTLRRAALF